MGGTVLGTGDKSNEYERPNASLLPRRRDDRQMANKEKYYKEKNTAR